MIKIRISKKLLLPLAILVGSCAVAALIVLSHSPDKVAPAQAVAWRVNAEIIKLGPQIPELKLYGKIHTPRYAKLESYRTATVIATPALAGATVKKGDTLLQMDNSESQILYDQHNAEVNRLKAQLSTEKNRNVADILLLKNEKKLYTLTLKELERQEALAAKHYVSASALDKVLQSVKRQGLQVTRRQLEINNHPHRIAELTAQLNKAIAILEQDKLNLKRANVLAPFDGQITKLDVTIGDSVQIGEVIIEMYDDSTLEITVQIPQRYYNLAYKAVDNKNSVRASVTYNGEKLPVTLSRLGGYVGEGSGAISGIFTFDQNTKIPIGISLPIVIDFPPILDAALLPSEALYDNSRVYKIIDSHLVATTITNLGTQFLTKGKQKVIVRGPELKNGDIILVTHLPNAITGLKVKIINEKKPN